MPQPHIHEGSTRSLVTDRANDDESCSIVDTVACDRPRRLSHELNMETTRGPRSSPVVRVECRLADLGAAKQDSHGSHANYSG